MKKYIELESISYWNAAVENEIKMLRKERNRQATQSLTRFGIFVLAAGAMMFAYQLGVFSDIDLAASFDAVSERVAIIANNLSNSLKEIALR